MTHEASAGEGALFSEVWSELSLSRRDRCLVAVSALTAMQKPAQLKTQLAFARHQGISEAELIEVVMCLARHAGWPSAVMAIGAIREAYAAEG
ncbi:MAG: carboxymuconolactone decarboxylase family protein [Pseudomonadota bacterium]